MRPLAMARMRLLDALSGRADPKRSALRSRLPSLIRQRCRLSLAAQPPARSLARRVAHQSDRAWLKTPTNAKRFEDSARARKRPARITTIILDTVPGCLLYFSRRTGFPIVSLNHPKLNPRNSSTQQENPGLKPGRSCRKSRAKERKSWPTTENPTLGSTRRSVPES